VRERVWNQAAKGKTAAHGLLGVNVTVTARELAENTGPGHLWPKYPPLRKRVIFPSGGSANVVEWLG
jgi:hypothetical protein